MVPKTPPSTPASESGCPTCPEIGVTKVSGRNMCDALEPKAQQDQRNLDYDSTQPGEIQKGSYNDTMKTRAWWLQHIAHIIRSEVGQEFARAILIHDISTSTAPVRENLAQNLVLLYWNLEKDHSSNRLESDQETLLASLQSSLSIPVPPKRTRRDEAQKTSLVRALLEFSGGRVEFLQHDFAEEYTASENADLYASVFDIARTKQFGDFDAIEMCNTLSKSPVFSGITIDVQDLKEWTTKMKASLRLGFPEGYLNLPPQVLNGFGFGQVDLFRAYLAHTSLILPALSTNNVLLLLTWSTRVSDRQLGVLRDWACSADGWNVYKQLVEDFQGPQSVEQLALTVAALVNYRRLLPHLPDHSNQPIESMYLADLDALLHSGSYENLGRVMEQTVFALIQVLHSLDQFKDLVIFLETALDREPHLPHIFYEVPHQYLHRRIKSQSHETAIAEISRIKMSKLRGDNDADWVNVTQPEDLPLQGLYVEDHSQRPYSDFTSPIMEANTIVMPYHIVAVSSSDAGHLSPPPGLRADQYALIRLSKVNDRNVWTTLDTKIGTVNEVPNIEELNDGSLEICILKSHRRTVQETLGKIFPDSDVELDYDPLDPTANYLRFGDDAAKRLYQCLFFERATRVIKKGWPAAVACYAYLLHEMFEPHSATSKHDTHDLN